jgi:hypothetical protein
MAYTRFDYLVDRQTEVFQDIETIKSYPSIDPEGIKLAELSKELSGIEKELDDMRNSDS